MNWNAILTELLKAVIGIAVPIIAIFACKAIAKLSEFLKAKTENVKTKAIIEEIESAVITAVSYVSQTMVVDLKKQGKFDKERAESAFEEAYNTVIATISEKAIEYLTINFGDPETYITAKIEEQVDNHNLFASLPKVENEIAKETGEDTEKVEENKD